MRPARPGQARCNVAHVQAEGVGVGRFGRVRGEEQALGPCVLLHKLHLCRVAAGASHVVERDGVDGEEPAGRAVLRGHVGDGCAVGQRQTGKSGAVELNELLDHTLRPQHLHHREHEVGGGDSVLQGAAEVESDDLRNLHVVGLAQHHGLRLNAADAPAQHAQAVDHGGVGVGAHQCVRVHGGQALGISCRDHRGQVLQVDLVHDAGTGRHQREVVEGALRPAQERVSLLVALELTRHVHLEGSGNAVVIDLDRVVDDQVHGHDGVDLAIVASFARHRRPHRRQVYDRGDAREVLH